MKRIIPIILIFCIFVSITLLTTGSVYASGLTYYVDNANGSDANDGLAPLTAWKSVNKINQTTFAPNDKILFKAGGLWTGSLTPKGSGVSGNPIIIDMYDSGSLPIINANGATGVAGAALCLTDQSYWEVRHLEFTNPATTEGDRRGVQILAKTKNVSFITLANLNIHDVKGIVGQNTANKKTAGIYFEASNISSSTYATMNDILIENCEIHDISNEGISFARVSAGTDYPGTTAWKARKYTNVSIKGNTIYNITKNAMILRYTDQTCVVEYNVCHDTATVITGNTIYTCYCYGTIFQYNEGYLNRSPDRDGSFYDADLRSPNTVWQYSYSHDNSHGLIWYCTVDTDSGIIVRYNISQNDKGILVCINYPFTSTEIYNNVFYIAENLSPTIIWEQASTTHTYDFYNNIIYNKSKTATYLFVSGYNTRDIDHNVFYGEHPSNEPSDAHKIKSDPQFVAPGTGGFGINLVDGYKLKPTSPCIDAGKVIANNGGKDYWGNALYNNLPDIGMSEYYADTITAPDKRALALEISSATALLNSKTVGVEAGNVPKQAYDDFKIAIDTASNFNLNIDAVQADIDAQVSNLQQASTAFNNAIILEVAKFEVTGAVSIQPDADLTKVTIVAKQADIVVKTVSALSDGTFTISLTPGVYSFSIGRVGYLRKTIADFTVTTENVQSLTPNVIQLLPGDAIVTDVNTIDLQDLQMFLSNFGFANNDESFDPIYDFNDDGYINLIDLQAILKNFGAVS